MRFAAASAFLLTACAAGAEAESIAVPEPPTGANLVLEGNIESAPEHYLVMGDLVLGAGATVPRHIHSGEEFLYVLGGSATLYRDGMPDLVLKAGGGVRIAPGLPHSAIAGPDGLRAVASWIVANGKPLREPAPE